MVLVVNGKTINVPNGSSVSVVNGGVFVDGHRYTNEDMNLEQLNIVINGDCGSIQVDSCSKIEVKGNVGDIATKGAVDVHGDVDGDIDAGGSVCCGDVGGDIDAGGSVCCG